MPSKRVRLDTGVLQQVELLAGDLGKTFQDMADEAFADLLEKHRRVVGLAAQLDASLRRLPANDAKRRR